MPLQLELKKIHYPRSFRLNNWRSLPLQLNQVKRTPQDYINELNIEPASRFKKAMMN